MNKQKRYVSFMLCLLMLFSIVAQAIPSVFASEKAVEILVDGQATQNITLEQTTKETLSANVTGIDSPAFQWQILLDAEKSLWVDIYDKTEWQCEISYALVKTLLDNAHSTYIRCAVTDGSETLYSNQVCVNIKLELEEAPQVTEYAATRYVALNAPKRMAAAIDDDVTDYVTITIKYLDIASLGGIESAIYSPYIATIERKTPFNQNVISPTFLGFAPFLDSNGNGTIDDDDQSADTLHVSYASVTSDIEIKVYYKPIKVNFAVKYYFQNINDDLYTENPSRYHTSKAETGTIVTNEYLESNAGETTGFTKMYHIPESVAADGSTVFECYYDRNYYLIQFDLNGGYGVDPIYARYGTPFIVNDPIRHGYKFTGWKLMSIDLNGNGQFEDALPVDAPTDLISTIPEYNYYYQAQWETVRTTYNVVYWLNDGNGGYDYLGSKIVPEDSGKTVSGSNDLSSSTICGLEQHTHGSGCTYKCNIAPHAHTQACYTLTCTQTDHTHYNACFSFNYTRYGSTYTASETLVTNTYTINRLNTSAVSQTDSYGNKIVRYNNSYYVCISNTWFQLGSGGANIPDNTTFTTGYTCSGHTHSSYTGTCYSLTCGSTEHAHSESCYSCQEHTHDNSCRVDASTFIFERADSNVLVEGDGSSVVNVYYKPKQYTLKFYYALENVTDHTYWVIGGTSYHFGGASGISTSSDTGDEVALLKHYLDDKNARDQLGQVDELPKLNTKGSKRNYTVSYDDTYNGAKITYDGDEYRFHYISFTSGYGNDISNLWPCDVFSSVTRTSANTHGAWSGKEAFVSAWNGEYNVWYSRNNANQTIKGNYEKLDDKILFATEPAGYDNVVAYACFWENGANINWSVPELYVYNIWVPVLAGESTDGIQTKVHNGVTYRLSESYDTCDDSDTTKQTQPSIAGLKQNGYTSEKLTLTSEQQQLYKEGYAMHFFYTQERNAFAMKNHGDNLVNITVNSNGTGGVPFKTTLSALSELDVLDENYEPPYPLTLEENAYYFEGWYTTEHCLPGTKVNLDTATMPSSGYILYANWVAETHTVRFFTTYKDLTDFEGGTGTNIYHTASAKHGTIVGTVETPIRSGDGELQLTFAGWFYMENGTKKAFSPLNMPVNSDMNIFAEWSSHSPQPFKISYVLLSNPSVKVADDTEGFAYGGTTRTFNAKAGDPYNQLYDGYNLGYFPTISSHSITIQAEADKDNPTKNVFTFHYVEAQDIEYTIRYVNKETNTVMGTMHYNTSASVVTERFKAFPNMVPDAFYKRLVLEVEWDEEKGKYVGTDNNVITFYYTPNTTSAYYAVHFMLEKQNATAEQKANYDINGNGGYEETGTHIEGVGKIDSTVYITPQNISGFSLIDNASVPVIYSEGSSKPATYSSVNNGYGIEITHSGTELYLFYERQDYPYEVHYYQYNTTTPLLATKNSVASYDSDVTETAPSIAGYTCVSETTQTITIREDEGGLNKLNTIIFYYAPLQYVAEYVAVPADAGWLSNTIEVITGAQSLVGSVPTANEYCEFVGWYLDEACTQSVGDYGVVDSVTNQFTPHKNKLSETGRNIFYAKFIKKAGNFTITRTDATDANQVFVYQIKNNATDDVYYATITGNGSVTIKELPLGSYTVTQQNDWSWRYTDSSVAAEHQNPLGTTVQFKNVEQNTQWLNFNSDAVVNKRGS